jgi:hypothetical protein
MFSQSPPEGPQIVSTSISARRRILGAVLTTVVVTALVAAPSFAGKGGKPGGGGGSDPAPSAFKIDNGVYAGTTTAYRGSSTATWVHARCYQGGTLVYEQYVSYGSAQAATLTLGPTPLWTGGGASCNGEDGYWQGSRWRVAATTTFSVAG